MAAAWKLSHRHRGEGISWNTIFVIGALPWLVAGSMGVWGLLDLRPRHFGWMQAPAIFGALLCTSVTVRFVLLLRGGLLNSLEMRALVRRQSREVYLVLYVLAAIKVIEYVTDAAVRARAIRVASLRVESVPYISMEHTMEGLQGYIASGVIALLMVRVVAVLYVAHRQRHGIATRRPQRRARR
jgi:hypothetical protein